MHRSVGWIFVPHSLMLKKNVVGGGEDHGQSFHNANEEWNPHNTEFFPNR